ncbi:hypothetical protein E2562_039416 [Oryza meyeriana var. granulata]|uniref:Uncharacterized protein n=1 Tax=Oryza meyeriana var. granulata TaxID=110450 RepID=A0A6G1EUK0_9ORYZ|nr:hypothetical protein E2562_039416 [Oryza meyeriana var. granulata]
MAAPQLRGVPWWGGKGGLVTSGDVGWAPDPVGAEDPAKPSMPSGPVASPDWRGRSRSTSGWATYCCADDVAHVGLWRHPSGSSAGDVATGDLPVGD